MNLVVDRKMSPQISYMRLRKTRLAAQSCPKGMLSLTLAATSIFCGCSTTSNADAESKRLESLRESNPALYELERARNENPATRDEPNWPHSDRKQ